MLVTDSVQFLKPSQNGLPARADTPPLGHQQHSAEIPRIQPVLALFRTFAWARPWRQERSRSR